MRDDINSDKFFALNNLGNTWIIEESAVSLACDTLWRNACEHSISIKNILQCELCHLSLAPVTGKKSRTAAPFIDAVWRYNMIQHLEEVHPQYAHPEKLIGHPLPAQILTSFTLTALEQEDANIPTSQWLMPLFEGEKENVHIGSGSHKQKTNNTGIANGKKARTSA